MSLKLKFRTLFPASVRATSPITLVRSGLAYVFGLDINELRTSLDPIYVPNSSGNVVVANNIGFVADGVTPNDAAFDAWWAAMPAAGSCLEFGAGRYLFSAAINKTMAAALQSVTIRGIGSDLTQLYWPAGGGLKITQGSSKNSAHIRDLSVITGAAGVGVGLWLNSTQTLGTSVQSDVTNVQFRGDDFDDINANLNYWSTGLSISGWSIVHCFNMNTYGKLPGALGGGVGMRISGVGGATGPVVGIYIKHTTFGWHGVGLQLNSNWEGIYFDTVNVVGQAGSVGIQNPNGLTHCGPLLSIINSQFDSGGDQINLQSNVQQLAVVDCSITVSTVGGTGIVNGGKDVIIQGTTFNTSAASTTGIAYSGDRGTIAGNIFVDHATGINLTGATNVIANPNTYSGVTTKVVNPGGVANTVIDFDTGGTVVYNGGPLGTPSSGNATNLSGISIQVNVGGMGAGVGSALANAIGTAGAPVTFNGALGTPSSGIATNLTGTAAGLTAGTATSSTLATNATNSAITNDTTTNATMFLAWVTANTGNLPLKVTSTKLSFNPSTGVLSSTSFTGAGTGLTGTAASLTAGTASAVAVGGITGLGTGVGTALGINIGSAGAPVLFNGAGGTPSSLTLTSATGLPIGTGLTGTGTGVLTALGVNAGTAGAFVVNGGALGTPSSGVGTNLTGTAAGLTAGNVTTNANLTGPVTSVGNATAIANNQITRAMEAQGVARSVIGVTGNSTANVADIQGTANQVLVVNNAGTALAFGQVNLASAAAVTGILPVANGGVNLSAWTAYTPTVTAQTPGGTPPTFTVNSADYWQNGKTITARADVTITAAGTGSGYIAITLPFTAAAFAYTGSSNEIVTGVGGVALVLSSGTIMISRSSAVATFIVTGQRVVAQVQYAVP